MDKTGRVEEPSGHQVRRMGHACPTTEKTSGVTETEASTHLRSVPTYDVRAYKSRDRVKSVVDVEP